MKLNLFGLEITVGTNKTNAPSSTLAPLSPPNQTIFEKGKQTIGKQSLQFDEGYLAQYSFLPRRIYKDIDLTNFLDSKNLTFSQILTLLADYDPDVSMALWNIIRLANSNMKVEVYKFTQPDEIDTAGQDLVDQFNKNANKMYGGIDNLINMWFMSAVLEGAVAAEAVFDITSGKVIDVVAVSPFTIAFEYNHATDSIFPYQYQLMPLEQTQANRLFNYVPMNPMSFWYIPVDPAIGDPYGRSPFTSAISEVYFNLKVLYDLRKVIHNQGWPRINVSVLTEILKKAAPESVAQDEQKLNDFITARIGEIKSAYDNLQPDDTFIHTDAVTVAMVETGRGNAAFDPGALLKAIERRVFRGLKQLPMLMGSNEGTTETHSEVQYAVFAKGIESFQKIVEDVLEGIYELMLRMEGSQCIINVEFDKIQTRDRYADAQADQLDIANQISMREEGWISNEEASIHVTGTKPVMSDEELAAQKAANIQLAQPTVPPSGTPGVPESAAPTKNAVKKKIIVSQRASFTKSGQKKKFARLHKRFTATVKKSFTDLEKTVPAKELITKVFDQYPKKPEYTLPNKIDTSSPIYNSVKDIVSQYFNEEKTKGILNDLSDEGGSFLLDAFENAGQGVLLGLADYSDIFKFQEFKLNDLGMQKLIDARADFFPQSVFETSQKEIARTVMDGYQNDKTVDEIATDLRGRFDTMRTNRSELIANTELNWATSQGTLQTMIKNNVDQKKWLTVGDDRVEEECQSAEDDGPINVTDTFSNGYDAPPAHPQCRCSVTEALDENWLAPSEAWTGGDDLSDEGDDAE